MWTQRWYHDNETLLPLELDIMYHMIYLELILMSQNISISLSYLWVSEWRSTTPHWIYGIMHRRWAPYKRLLRLRISQVPPFHFVRFVQTHQHFKWFFNGMVASFWSIFTWAETYTRHWPTHIRYSRANHWVHKSYTTVRQMIIYWIICSSTLLLMVQLAQCYCSDIFAFSASNLTAGALSPSFSSSRSSSHSFCLSCSRSLASHTLYLIHSMNNQRSSHLGFTLSPMIEEKCRQKPKNLWHQNKFHIMTLLEFIALPTESVNIFQFQCKFKLANLFQIAGSGGGIPLCVCARPVRLIQITEQQQQQKNFWLSAKYINRTPFY